METMRTRVEWIEFLRVVSAVWVFVTHYVVCYWLDVVSLWDAGMPLVGITGKLAMSMFLIIFGYLAALQKVRGRAIIPYLIKRYLRLCLPLLAVTIIAALVRILKDGAPAAEMFHMAFSGSFLLKMTELCTQAWCLRDFLFALILITVLGNNRFSILLLAYAGMTLYRYGQIWSAIAVLGAFLVYANRLLEALPVKVEKYLFCAPMKVLMLIAVCVVIRRPEGYLAYTLDGFACAVVFEVIAHSALLQKLFSHAFWLKLGKITFEFFLIHVLIFPFPHWLAQTLFASVLPQYAVQLFSLFTNLILSFLAAYALNRLLATKPLAAPYRLAERWQAAWSRK